MKIKTSSKIRLVDVVALINQIVAQEVSHIDPALVMEDLKTSKFKVRAIDGELDQILKSNSDFISTLWKINKIDTIVNRYFDQLVSQDKKLLLEYLSELEAKTINNVSNMMPENRGSDERLARIIRLEIFKDKNKIN